jgi:hypothetical protein
MKKLLATNPYTLLKRFCASWRSYNQLYLKRVSLANGASTRKNFKSISFFTYVLFRISNFRKKILLEPNKFSNPASILISTIFNPLINLGINLIDFLHSYIIIPQVGRRTLPIKRNLYYGLIKLKAISYFDGIDLRNYHWKKKALDMLLIGIKNNQNILDSENLVMVEIGAANGLVTLFLAKVTVDSGKNFTGYCIEPNLKNCVFIEDTATINNLDVLVLPLAVGNKTELISFSNGLTKGYVGNAITHNPHNQPILMKPMISLNDSAQFISSPTICYIDAYMNEIQMLKAVLNAYPSLKLLVIEFDSGFPMKSRLLLKEEGFTLADDDTRKSNSIERGYNYLFVRDHGNV